MMWTMSKTMSRAAALGLLAAVLALLVLGVAKPIVNRFQTTLTSMAQASGLRIRSARKLPERERPPFRLIGMGINLTTDIESVQKILYAIETAKPYLFVEAVDISPLGGANPPPGRRMLEVRLDVFAAPRREQP